MISSKLDKEKQVFIFESDYEDENIALVSTLELLESYLNSIVMVAKNEAGNTNKIVRDTSNNFIDKLKNNDYINDTIALYDWVTDEKELSTIKEDNKNIGYLLMLMNLMSNELKDDPTFKEISESIKNVTKEMFGMELDHKELFSLLDSNKICKDNEDRFNDLIYAMLGHEEQTKEIEDDEIEEEL